LRSGALGICISPVNGSPIFQYQKERGRCRECEDDQRRNEGRIEAGEQAEVCEMMASQNTSTARNGTGIDPPDWTNNAKRICTRAVLT
jgi:hypothetical protein